MKSRFSFHNRLPIFSKHRKGNISDEVTTAERERKNDILQDKLLHKLLVPHITFYGLIYHLATIQPFVRK